MARRSARLVAALAVGASTHLAGGCGAVGELLQLQERIEREGYRNVSTFHEDFGSSANEVQVDASTGRGEPPPAGNEEIAGVVWRTYPRRFDRVVVTLDDRGEVFTRTDLEATFGPRAEQLDEREFSDDLREGIRGVAIGALIFLGLGVAAIITTVVLLRRRRRRNPPAPPAGYGGYGGYGPGGYGPPGGPPGWQPPPPPPGPPPGWVPPPGRPVSDQPPPPPPPQDPVS